jgi:hypothetical protein
MTNTNQADNLIAGLQILKIYKLDMSIHSSHRSGRCVETQEEEFSGLSKEDRERLFELGWWTNEKLIWAF